MGKTSQKESFKGYFLRNLKKMSLSKEKGLFGEFVSAKTMGDLRSIVSRYKHEEILELYENAITIMYAYLDGIGLSGDAAYKFLKDLKTVGKRRCGLV